MQKLIFFSLAGSAFNLGVATASLCRFCGTHFPKLCVESALPTGQAAFDGRTA